MYLPFGIAWQKVINKTTKQRRRKEKFFIFSLYNQEQKTFCEDECFKWADLWIIKMQLKMKS